MNPTPSAPHAERSSRWSVVGTAAFRPWASWAGLVAGLVVATQLVWRGVLLSKGFFGQDDFLVMSQVAREGWSGVFSGGYNGWFSPGAAIVATGQVSVAPLGWGAAVLLVLVAQTACALLMWLVLCRLLGDRWIRLPLLVLFCFSPLTLWATQWWSLALQFWPATFGLLLAVWALLVAIQTGARWPLAVVLAGFAGSLAFSQQAVLHALVLPGVAVLALPGERVRDRVQVLARPLRDLWFGLLLLLAGYGVLRAFVAPLRFDLGPDFGEVVTTHLRHLLSELWGGPWTGDLVGHAYLVPPSWAVAVNGALLLALVGWTLQHGGASAKAGWLLLVVHAGATVGLLVVLGQASTFASLGVVPRLAADLAPVFVICAAGALSAVQLPDVRLSDRYFLPSRRFEPVASGVVAVALVAAAAVSTAFLAPNLYHREAKAYVSLVQRQLADQPRVVLLDSAVPAEVIDPVFGVRARVSEVVGNGLGDAVFGVPSGKVRVVDGAGLLVEPVLADAVSMQPGERSECAYPVRANGRWVPLQRSLPRGRWVARIGYYTSAQSFATAQAAGTTFEFAVSPGLHVVYLEMIGEVNGVHLTLDDAAATMCVTNVDVGRATAPVQ